MGSWSKDGTAYETIKRYDRKRVLWILGYLRNLYSYSLFTYVTSLFFVFGVTQSYLQGVNMIWDLNDLIYLAGHLIFSG